MARLIENNRDDDIVPRNDDDIYIDTGGNYHNAIKPLIKIYEKNKDDILDVDIIDKDTGEIYVNAGQSILAVVGQMIAYEIVGGVKRFVHIETNKYSSDYEFERATMKALRIYF